jgi:hypothetical protein
MIIIVLLLVFLLLVLYHAARRPPFGGKDIDWSIRRNPRSTSYSARLGRKEAHKRQTDWDSDDWGW